MFFSKGTALVCVDDDEIVLTVLSYQLKKVLGLGDELLEMSKDPLEIPSFIEGLLLEGYHVPLVIVDFQMPVLNGSALIRLLHSKHPELKFVMLSGEASDIQVEALYDDKLLHGFIAKPWSEEDIRRIILPLLSERIVS
jgi:CheY-like chemotaxis protein